jgi:endonuclease III
MNEKTALKQLRELDKLSSHMRLAAENWKYPWHTLFSTILSARTKDEVTIPVSENLFKKYSNLEKLSKANLKDIEKIINPINFYKNKSKYLVECAKVLVIQHDSKIPTTIDELIKLPGVGRKTANVFLAEEGYHGVAVDTHLGRIAKKLGWTDNINPEKVEYDLKNLFSKKHWNSINPIVVRFGKTYTSRKKEDELLSTLIDH